MSLGKRMKYHCTSAETRKLILKNNGTTMKNIYLTKMKNTAILIGSLLIVIFGKLSVHG